jgi:hypothetical protein
MYKMAWKNQAYQFLELIKKDPYRNYTNQINHINEMAAEYDIDLEDEQFRAGIKFQLDLLKKGYTNEQLQQRINEYAAVKSGTSKSIIEARRNRVQESANENENGNV